MPGAADPTITDGGTREPPPTQQPTQQQQQPPPQQQQQQQDPPKPRNVVMLPQDALTKRLNAERLKGERRLRADLDARAKELGFADLDSLLARQQQPEPQRRERSNNGDGDRQERRVRDDGNGQQRPPANNAADLDRGRPMPPRGSKAWNRIQRQLDDERRARIGASRRARELEGQVQVERTRRHLEKAALMAGVRDVDFAIHLLEQHAATLTEEQAQTFDEAVYFSGLRKDRPYLFGETVVPANTGTAGAGGDGHEVRPPPPGGGGAGGGSGKIDTRKLSPQEWQDYLQKKGLNMVGTAIS